MVSDDGDREEGKEHKDLGVRFSGKPIDLGFSGESVPLGLSQKWSVSITLPVKWVNHTCVLTV